MKKIIPWVLCIYLVLAISSLFVPQLRSIFFFFGHGYDEPSWIPDILPWSTVGMVAVLSSGQSIIGVTALMSECSGFLKFILGFCWIFIMLSTTWAASLHALYLKTDEKTFVDLCNNLDKYWILFLTNIATLGSIEIAITGIMVCGFIWVSGGPVYEMPPVPGTFNKPAITDQKKPIDKVWEYLNEHRIGNYYDMKEQLNLSNKTLRHVLTRLKADNYTGDEWTLPQE